MPQSIELIGLTTIVFAVGVVALTYVQRRWPNDDTTDTLVILWRKWAARGKLETVPSSRAKPKPKAKPRSARKPKAPPKPISHAAPKKPVEEAGSPKPVVETAPQPVVDAAPPQPVDAAPPPPPAAKTRERLVRLSRRMKAEGPEEHVPLQTAEEREQKEKHEPKLLLRQRFRRGLRRTRERLGAEMREAFTGGATPEAFDRIEEALVASDVGVATATTITDALRDEIGLSDTTLPKAVRDAMVAQLEDSDRRLRLVRGKLSVWVVVGVNGTGKTTTIAKLANRAKDVGLRVVMAAADTFRAAAVEQLSEWGRRLDVHVVKQGQGADPGAVVFDALAHAKANDYRLLIVDTAGRLHTRKPLMDELQKVFRVIERDPDAVIAETLLVVDATTGQNGIAQAKAFKEAVNVTGLALAKLDGTAKGGIVFSVERELGVPVKAVGVGEKERDLVPFEPGAFVDALIGTGEDAEAP